MEALGRGVVAVSRGGGKVYLGWRLLGTEPEGVAFNVYRATAGGPPTKINAEPVTKSTDFVDDRADLAKANAYTVRPLIGGREEPPGGAFTLAADAPVRPYLAIPLKTLEGHRPNDASPGDLDGDGEYEIVVKQEMRPRDMRVYTTVIPSGHRLATLMHDPQYRLSVAWQNVGYNLPTQPGFYLGDGPTTPTRPAVAR
ncbi:MAG: hypothetical protein LC745_05840 [Planctomycetia bacterium]|nr:hypothetical protein [Planctomycetia bacterium]